MREPDFLLARGSTPVIKLGLPFAPEGDDVLWAVFAQESGPVLEYQRNAAAVTAPPTGELTAAGTTVQIRMTQGDTLRLAAGDCRLQLRLRRSGTGAADTFLPLWGYVVDTEKEGEI